MTSISTQWRKATASNNGGDCVELAFYDDRVLVRDSKYLRDPANDPTTAPIIEIPATSWPAFLTRVLTDNATQPDHQHPRIEHDAAGGTRLHGADGTVLVYTASEWCAFIDGARRGEFDQMQSISTAAAS